MSEMGQYIKSQYNGQVHLLTGSFTGADEDWLPSHPYFTDDFDVWAINMYDHNIPTSFSTHFIKSVSNVLLNRKSSRSFERAGNRIKPLILSEVGLNDAVGTTTFEPLPSGCQDNITELRRLMWQGMFSGAAGSLCWSTWYYSDLFPEFQQIKNFVQDFDFGSAYESWRPGSSRIFEYNGRDHYEPDSLSIDLINNEKEYRADLLYLMNKECTNILGVMTNKTYNIYSSSLNTNCDIVHFLPNSYGVEQNYVLNHYQLPYTFQRITLIINLDQLIFPH
jgi:hypothetical protein